MPTSQVALLVLSRSLIRSRVELELENLALLFSAKNPYAMNLWAKIYVKR